MSSRQLQESMPEPLMLGELLDADVNGVYELESIAGGGSPWV